MVARVGLPRGGAPGYPVRHPAPATGAGRLRPHARDAPVTGGAVSVRSDPPPLDHVPETLDQEVATVGAPGMLPPAHAARKIARVDELEAGGRPDLAGAQQRRRGRVVGVRHLVILVE